MTDLLETYNLLGITIGLCTFLIIGIFHPLVIKGEYYFGVKIWRLFLLFGLICLAAACLVGEMFWSIILGVTGFSSLWGIGEIFQQQERVRKGWFPRNPRRKYPFDNERQPSAKLNHIAMYVTDIEAAKTFFTKYFGAVANDLYHNAHTGLKTYFLTFDSGTKLEIMSRPDVNNSDAQQPHTGYAHIALSVGGKQQVDKMTKQLRADGFNIISEPRTTGDGYYESCVEGPDGCTIEITA